MTYFQHQEQEPVREQLFHEPVTDDDPPEDPEETAAPQPERAWRHILDAEERENRLQRRDRLRLLAGVSDFFLVILGTLLVLALVALVVTLILWVQGDITERFPVLQHLSRTVQFRG